MLVKNVLATLAPSILDTIARIEAGEADHWTLPWGAVPRSNGRVFVTRKNNEWRGGAARTTVTLDGVPIWARGTLWWEPARQGWLDMKGERRLLRHQRAERRREGEQYLALLDEAVRLVEAGVPLRHDDGQQGGFFTLSCGGRVSARGLAARMGVAVQPGWTEVWGDWIAQVVGGATPDHPHRLPRKAGWKEVEAA